MKYFFLLSIILLLSFSIQSCSEDTSVFAVIQNGEKLGDSYYVPFTLEQNFPNPHDGFTTLRFRLDIQMRLKLQILNDNWQVVYTVFDRELDVGSYSFGFAGKDSEGNALPNGDYYYTLEGNGITLVRQMKILK